MSAYMISKLADDVGVGTHTEYPLIISALSFSNLLHSLLKDLDMKQLAGSFGSLVAGACCLGLPPLIAMLTGIGMGFILHDAILIPLLILMLSFTVWSLNSSKNQHGQTGPFSTGVVSSILAFAGLWVFAPISWLGFAGLIGASIWDIVVIRKRGEVYETKASEERTL